MIFRKTAKALGAAGSSMLLWQSYTAKNAGKEEVVETRGFPLRITPNVAVRPQAAPLYLAGAGKIIKLGKGYFKDTAEELCKVGVAFSPSTADRAKDWIARQSAYGNTSLTEQLLLRENIVTPYSISNPLKVAVFLKITSPMRSGYLIHILEESFHSCPKSDYTAFMTTLASALGDTLNKGDEVAFHFFDNGDITITYDGVATGMVNIPPITQALLDAFLHPTEGIVPELYEDVMRNIGQIRYD